MTRRKSSFLAKHSLTLVIVGIIGFWLWLFVRSAPSSHAENLFGNSVADWLGTLAIVVATKYFREAGSPESRQPKSRPRHLQFLYRHSLLLILGATGIVWFVMFMSAVPNSRSGEVLGSVTSEWGQLFGLVLLTKYFREAGSKDE